MRPSVGPCASCHGMVCGDCCTLTTDPAGKSVICLSCTRMVAGVQRKPLVRRSTSSKTTALIILMILALGAFVAILKG